MGVNRVFLLGNLGADPELRYTPSQHPVCTFNLATGERRKGADGQWTDHTEWHRVVAWDKTAENVANYLSKGRQVFVEGKIQTKKWQDKEGKDRYTTEIVASNIQFVGGRGEGGMAVEKSGTKTRGSQSQEDAPADFGQMPTAAAGNVSLDDDDIPF